MDKKYIQIDGKKLAKILTERNLTYTEVSKNIGMAKNYISETIRRGYISTPSMMLITRIYGIEKADIELKKETEKAKPKTEENYAELYKCIYSAVYHAVKKALEDDCERS